LLFHPDEITRFLADGSELAKPLSHPEVWPPKTVSPPLLPGRTRDN
jgi:hypothetical protein